MTKILFENDGIIPIQAITVLGVSSKEGENPIGYFGTGLKYAIGILLRNGCRIKVFAGEEVCEFGVNRATIRKDEFDIVTLNGRDLGFTTDIGKNWKLWQAYRELYCNTVDEGGQVTLVEEDPLPEDGKTKVIVEGRAFLDVHYDRGSFILERGEGPLFALPDVEVFEGPTKSVFYRGIKVHEVQEGSCKFTYNILAPIDLTEDRTAMYQFEVDNKISAAMAAAPSEAYLREVLVKDDFSKEGKTRVSEHRKPSKAFFEAVEKLSADRTVQVNHSATTIYKKHKEVRAAPRPHTMSDVERRMLDRAVRFASDIGFPVSDYPIEIVSALGTDTLAMAADGKITLAQRAFNMGTKYVAGTLIEEFCHLRHGYGDCTRSFQNFLIDQLVTMGETYKWKEPL